MSFKMSLFLLNLLTHVTQVSIILKKFKLDILYVHSVVGSMGTARIDNIVPQEFHVSDNGVVIE